LITGKPQHAWRSFSRAGSPNCCMPVHGWNNDSIKFLRHSRIFALPINGVVADANT
jgi:hypothetical protein